MRSKNLNLDALRACLELDQLDLAEKLISTKKSICLIKNK